MSSCSLWQGPDCFLVCIHILVAVFGIFSHWALFQTYLTPRWINFIYPAFNRISTITLFSLSTTKMHSEMSVNTLIKFYNQSKKWLMGLQTVSLLACFWIYLLKSLRVVALTYCGHFHFYTFWCSCKGPHIVLMHFWWVLGKNFIWLFSLEITYWFDLYLISLSHFNGRCAGKILIACWAN